MTTEAERTRRREYMRVWRRRGEPSTMKRQRKYNYQQNERVAEERRQCDLVAIKRERYLAKLATIPADTRTISARLLGDPLPGRSALEFQHKGAYHEHIRTSSRGISLHRAR